MDGAVKAYVKHPVKKLFAVATLVGATSAGTMAVTRSAPADRAAVKVVEVDEVDEVDEVLGEGVAPTEESPPIVRYTVTPLTLASGSPACGNVVSKAGRSRCPPVTAATVIIGTAVTGGAPTDDAGVATRARPRPFQFHLLR